MIFTRMSLLTLFSRSSKTSNHRNETVRNSFLRTMTCWATDPSLKQVCWIHKTTCDECPISTRVVWTSWLSNRTRTHRTCTLSCRKHERSWGPICITLDWMMARLVKWAKIGERGDWDQMSCVSLSTIVTQTRTRPLELHCEDLTWLVRCEGRHKTTVCWHDHRPKGTKCRTRCYLLRMAFHGQDERRRPVMSTKALISEVWLCHHAMMRKLNGRIKVQPGNVAWIYDLECIEPVDSRVAKIHELLTNESSHKKV